MTRARTRKRARSTAPAPKPAPAKRGRPRSRLPKDVLSRLGPIPDGALQRSHWASRMLAELAWLQASGQVDATLVSELRATISAMGRAMPLDIQMELERAVREDAEAIEADDRGPQMTPI